MAKVRYGECQKCIIANPKNNPGHPRRGDLVYDNLLREWACVYCGWVEYNVTPELQAEAASLDEAHQPHRNGYKKWNKRAHADFPTMGRIAKTAPKYIELIERGGY